MCVCVCHFVGCVCVFAQPAAFKWHFWELLSSGCNGPKQSVSRYLCGFMGYNPFSIFCLGFGAWLNMANVWSCKRWTTAIKQSQSTELVCWVTHRADTGELLHHDNSACHLWTVRNLWISCWYHPLTCILLPLEAPIIFLLAFKFTCTVAPSFVRHLSFVSFEVGKHNVLFWSN